MLDQDKSKQQLLEELAEVRRQEAKYRRLYQSMMDAFVSVDLDGSIREYNEAYRKMLGYKPEELLNLRYMDITPEKWHAFEAKIVREQVLSRGYSDTYEKEYRRKNGTIFPVELRSFLIRDDQGQPYSMWAIVRDITERKLAVEALQKAYDELEKRVAETRLNEARLKAVLQLGHMAEASLQAITDFALEQAVALTKSKIGYLAFMNEDETVLTMHSWSKEAMAECAISDKLLVYPLETTGLWGEAARQRKPIVTNDYAAPNPWKKGLPEGHVEIRRHMNVPILDAGHIVIVAGVGNKGEDYDESDVRQLTLLMEGMWTLIQRQRAQTDLDRYRDHLEQLVEERTGALQQAHDELRAMYDGMFDGLLVVDIETKRFLRANMAMCRMLGYSETELRSLSVEDIHRRQDLPFVLEQFHAFAEGKLHISVDVPFVRKDGSVFYVLVSGSRVACDDHPCIVGFFHDITDRKRAEDALRKEHRTLKHLLQSSDHERQLIAYEIHDGLAQHLAAAIMQFQTFDHLKGIKPRLAAKAYDAGLKMLRQGHFESRRLIAGVRPPILDESGVVVAVGHLVNEQNRLKGPKIDFRSGVAFDRLVPTLENAIYRIIQEALTNACQHSKSEKVRVSLLQRADRVRIEIQDWGAGFDVKALPKNRFGLEGIRQRARLLGGKVSIKSSLGKGTRVAVELPVVVRDEAA